MWKVWTSSRVLRSGSCYQKYTKKIEKKGRPANACRKDRY
jgi:hypothetical protein